MIIIKRVGLKGETLEISFSNPDTGEVHDVSYKQKPLPEFMEAFVGMSIIQKKLPLNKKEVEAIVVKSVSPKFKDAGYYGVIVGTSIEISEQNRPWNQPSPLYEFEQHEDLEIATTELIKQTKRYINGERQQGDLFVKKTEGEDPDDDEASEAEAHTPDQDPGFDSGYGRK